METIMAQPTVTTIVVYDPPTPELPFLVAMLYSDGSVSGSTAKTAADAQEMADDLAERSGVKRSGA
jgi:hypothetical protein